ncbi:hypothetical protein ACJRO7_012785 [Eucalyptus globulus]|uniref:Cytochrome P450 n=1 Tax=Eucalyptus globulus TaxID=34317 RepID=A0ABD3LUJ5_EUCGL
MNSLLPTSYLLAVLIALPALALLLSVANKRIPRKPSPCGAPPPGRFRWPVLRETLELLHRGREGRSGRFLDERVDRHGSCIFATSLFGEKTAVFCDAVRNKFPFSTRIGRW